MTAPDPELPGTTAPPRNDPSGPSVPRGREGVGTAPGEEVAGGGAATGEGIPPGDAAGGRGGHSAGSKRADSDGHRSSRAASAGGRGVSPRDSVEQNGTKKKRHNKNSDERSGKEEKEDKEGKKGRDRMDDPQGETHERGDDGSADPTAGGGTGSSRTGEAGASPPPARAAPATDEATSAEERRDRRDRRLANKDVAIALVADLCGERQVRLEAIVARRTLLRDPATRRLLLEHRARANVLRRAVVECERTCERIPPALELALRQVLDDDTPMASSAFAAALPDEPAMLGGPDRTAAAAAAGNAALSPQRTTGAQYAAQLRSAVATASVATAPNVTSPVGRESAAAAFTRDACCAHTPLSCRPLGVELPRAVAAAHEARRCGRRRDEIALLLQLLAASSSSAAPDPPAAMRTLARLAEAHSALAEHDTAEAYAFDWVLLADRFGDPRQAAKAMMAVADARRGAGDLAGASDWFEKAAARAKHS